MNRLRSTILLTAAALGILSLGVTFSYAADTKVIPGGLCFSFDGSPARNGAGNLFNTSGTQAMSVLCYLVRDNPAAKPTKVEVSVVDNSSAATGVKDISCFMRIANRFGTVFATGSTVKTIGVNPAGTVLNVPVPANLADGTLIVVCTIPRRGIGDANSWLASIKYTELDSAL